MKSKTINIELDIATLEALMNAGNGFANHFNIHHFLEPNGSIDLGKLYPMRDCFSRKPIYSKHEKGFPNIKKLHPYRVTVNFGEPSISDARPRFLSYKNPNFKLYPEFPKSDTLIYLYRANFTDEAIYPFYIKDHFFDYIGYISEQFIFAVWLLTHHYADFIDFFPPNKVISPQF